MDISVVIPLYNEAESLPELHDWIVRVMQANHFSYEIVFIDDGSRDSSWKVVEQLAEKNPNVRGIKFRRNYGKAAGLNVGFEAAHGNVIITMDADLQDSPDEIPGLYGMIVKEGYDLVSGWKKKRYDNAMTKNLPSKLYNATTRWMSGVKLHDMNCGLKAYRSDVVKSIEVYGEMHRYIPVIAARAGFTRIGEKVVQHQARKYGESKFGASRFVRGPLDLLSIMFVSKFGKRPMHIFGLIGTLMFMLGFFSAVYLGVSKLWIVYHDHAVAPRVTESPWFFIALTAMVIGTQLFLAGFLAELIARNSPDRNVYLVEKRIGEGVA
ncbi:MAG TPA: glycosyltransferase family 2 protein [Bacteroidia bacterium]|nr:glycosyltransferase family 2 protein [Bacteroidia bacterium]